MTQQPNVINESNSTLNPLPLPVSRKLGSGNTKILELSSLKYSIPSPDSGYALKLIKSFQHLWTFHHKNKLISKIISNLVIYHASKIGRAPTKKDFQLVISALKIKENDLGVLNEEVLIKSSHEPIKGLHLSQLIDTYSEDKI